MVTFVPPDGEFELMRWACPMLCVSRVYGEVHRCVCVCVCVAVASLEHACACHLPHTDATKSPGRRLCLQATHVEVFTFSCSCSDAGGEERGRSILSAHCHPHAHVCTQLTRMHLQVAQVAHSEIGMHLQVLSRRAPWRRAQVPVSGRHPAALQGAVRGERGVAHARGVQRHGAWLLLAPLLAACVGMAGICWLRAQE